MLAEFLFGAALYGIGAAGERSDRKKVEAQIAQQNRAARKTALDGYRNDILLAAHAVMNYHADEHSPNFSFWYSLRGAEDAVWSLYAASYMHFNSIHYLTEQEQYADAFFGRLDMTIDELLIWFADWLKKDDWVRDAEIYKDSKGNYYRSFLIPVKLRYKENNYPACGKYNSFRKGRFLVPIILNKYEKRVLCKKEDSMHAELLDKVTDYWHEANDYIIATPREGDYRTFLKNAPDAHTVIATLTGLEDWETAPYHERRGAHS